MEVVLLKNIFKLKSIIKENESLREAIGEQDIDGLIDISRKHEEKQNELNRLNKSIEDVSKRLTEIENQIINKKSELLAVDEEILMESFSLYKPKYDLVNSVDYKERLAIVRTNQKDMVKSKLACTGNPNWSVNGKKSEGKKMVNDMIKLLLRSFNNECDDCITKVKFNNVELAERRIEKSFDTINKLGRVMSITISNKYKKLKYDELYLAYEYQLKKQEEKEEQKRLKEQLREEKTLQKEIEQARKDIEKEQKHYSKALNELEKQLKDISEDTERIEVMKKIENVKNNLDEIDKNLKNVDYRAANKRAGYVYIISNIGSFGEDIYKIGMTRRLEPMDRVNELGDASVPFNFDIHAMIFSNDAPTLENQLHKAFDKHKVNMINTRREFFKIPLVEIEKVVKENHDKTVEFSNTPDASQYRESEKIREKLS